jgi:mutator protein MutT
MPMLTVVAGVIEQADRLLIAQRKPGDRLAHLWEFPGGKLEPGETPEQALVRELHEEFEISSEVLEYLGVNVHAYEHITVELLAYRVRYTGGTFALHDHQAIRWVAYAELDDYAFAPADIPLVRLVQERKLREQMP